MSDEFDPNSTIVRRIARLVVPSGRRLSDLIPAVAKAIMYLAVAWYVLTTKSDLSLLELLAL